MQQHQDQGAGEPTKGADKNGYEVDLDIRSAEEGEDIEVIQEPEGDEPGYGVDTECLGLLHVRVERRGYRHGKKDGEDLFHHRLSIYQ